MTEQLTTFEVLDKMRLRFPRQVISKETVEAYEQDLADIDPVHLGLICRQLWRSLDWFPSVNQIRRAYFDALHGPDSAARSWDLIWKWTRYGYRPHPTSHKTIAPRAEDGFDVLALKAVAIMGWAHMWDGTEEKYLRRDYLAAYEQARSQMADTFAREGMMGIEPSIGDGAAPALGGGR